jgi:Zn-dependent metalloprotease
MSAHCHRRGPANVGRCCIAPPYLLERLAESGDDQQREAAEHTLASLSIVHEHRALTAQLIADPAIDVQLLGLVARGTGSAVKVYDAHGLPFNSFELPGNLLRDTHDPPVADVAANDAFDGARDTLKFYDEVLGRNGIDGAGMDVISSVHVSDPNGRAWENAAWISTQMAYGEGGLLFHPGSLTSAIDVIGHELTHGVTQFTAALEYRSQSGALNESMSDVFGSLVKQHVRKETAATADWLIGAGLLIDPQAKALRSMLEPGTAFPGDPQPGKMSDYQELPETERGDNGGVHYNSGIPNRAFALVATKLGGNSWDRAGRIWYKTLTEQLRPDSQFKDAAQATLDVAEELFPGGEVGTVVEEAWKAVEVLT